MALPERQNTMEDNSLENKLYVGNLAYATTESDLRLMFAQAGAVMAVEVIKDHASGQSKGFGFVTMGSAAEAKAAISLFHATDLAGRTLTVNLSRKRENSRPPANRAGASGPAKKSAQTRPSRKPGPAVGGYQSRYSAFGDSNTNAPTRPRRRGGSQRH